MSRAKISTFVDNKSLNQGQFYYCFVKLLSERIFFDGKYHSFARDSI